MAIVDQGFRSTFAVTPFSPALVRGIMEGRINVGAGPFEIPAAEPLPWDFVDPHVSPQSIFIPAAGNAAAAAMLAAGWWVEFIEPSTMRFHPLVAPTGPVVMSYAVVG